MVVVVILTALLGLPTGFVAGWLACQLLNHRARVAVASSSHAGEESFAAQVIGEVQGLTREVRGSVGRHRASLTDAQVEMRAIKAGDDQAVSVHLEGLLRDNERLLGQLIDSETKLSAQEDALHHYMQEARVDSLTSLENRRAFENHLAQRFAECQRKGTEFCLAMIDVDHFKRINDQHGHPAGDEVLKGLGRVLAASVREMDVVGRMGGEEFAVLLPGTTLYDGQGISERLRCAIEETRFVFEDLVLPVTASIGVASVSNVADAADLISQADRALYAAKKAGRNRAYYHSPAGYDPVPRTMVEVTAN